MDPDRTRRKRLGPSHAVRKYPLLCRMAGCGGGGGTAGSHLFLAPVLKRKDFQVERKHPNLAHLPARRRRGGSATLAWARACAAGVFPAADSVSFRAGAASTRAFQLCGRLSV